MSRHMWGWAIALVCSLMFAGCDKGPQADPAKDAPPSSQGSASATQEAPKPKYNVIPADVQVSWGEPVEGLRLGISTDKSQYSSGELVYVTLWLQNVTDKPLSFIPPADARVDPGLGIDLRLLRKVGSQEISGKVIMAKYNGRAARARGNRQWSMAEPGKTYAVRFPCPTKMLAGAFVLDHLPEQGDYQLSAEYMMLYLFHDSNPNGIATAMRLGTRLTTGRQGIRIVNGSH